MVFNFLPIGILGLLIVPAFLTVLIILLVKGGKVARWIIGGVIVLVLFLGLFSVRATAPRMVHNVQPAVFIETVSPTEDPSLWQPHLEAEMIPEIYSGKDAAAFGLGMQLQDTIQTATGGHLEKILIAEDSENTEIALLEKLRQGIQTAFPEIPVLINTPDSTGTKQGQIQISLSVQNQSHNNLIIPELQNGNSINMQQHLHVGNHTGTVQAVVQTIDGKFIKEVTYDHRPWLNNLQTLQSSGDSWQPKVCRSYSIATTKEEAVQQATEQARQYITQQMPNRPIASISITLDDLRSGGIIVDEYTQQLQALSGPVWRAALLLDVSLERLAPLQNRFVTQQHRVVSSWAKLALSLAGMIVLICLVYIVLNWLTKGYYSARLAILAVLLAILFAGILLILNRAGFRPLF